MPKSQEKCKSKEPNMALREARESRGLTQAQVAEQIGVSEKQVSRWENGECIPQSYTKKKLCLLFEKSEADLNFAGSRQVQQVQEAVSQAISVPATQKISGVTQQTIYQTHIPMSSGRTFPRMTRGLLFGVLLGSILVLVTALVFLPRLGSSPRSTPLPSPTLERGASSTLHQVQQDCLPNSNEAGSLKIFTKQDEKEEVLCYEGAGSLSLSLGFVRKVEVGHIPAQWTYLNIAGDQHLTPMSGKPNLYWCPLSTRAYKSFPIRILKITVSPESPGQKCTNGKP